LERDKDSCPFIFLRSRTFTRTSLRTNSFI